MCSKKWYLKRNIPCNAHLLNELLETDVPWDDAIAVSARKLRKLWDSLCELRSSMCERWLERTVLRPVLLLVKTAQFTQFFCQVWNHRVKSLSLTESVWGAQHCVAGNTLPMTYRLSGSALHCHNPEEHNLDATTIQYLTSHIHILLPLDWHTSMSCCTGLFEMKVWVLTTCHTQYTWDSSICIFLFNRTTLPVYVTYRTGALYFHPLWFYKHQHDNWVHSKLFVACQRWWFQWRFWFVPSVPGYTHTLSLETVHTTFEWNCQMVVVSQI